MTSPSDPNQPDQPDRDPDLPPMPSEPDQPPFRPEPDQPPAPSEPPADPWAPPAPEPDTGFPPEPGSPGDTSPLPPPVGEERPLPPPADSPFAPPPPPAGAPGSPLSATPVPGPGGTTLVEWPQRAQSAVVDWFGPGLLAGVFQFTDIYWVLALAALIWALYNAWLAGESGQSIGRRWAGTRLVKTVDGDTLGGPLGVVRHLLHVVDAVICFVGFLFPLWDAKRQTLADKLVGSVVVKA